MSLTHLLATSASLTEVGKASLPIAAFTGL